MTQYAQGAQKPVSRFWACIFANGLIGLLWSMKFKKARKHLVLLAVPVVVFVGISYTNTGVIDSELDPDMLTVPDSLDHTQTFGLVFSVVWAVVMMYFMYRWSTEYNLMTCGFESKGEWKKYNTEYE
jgi:hypothetical protein